MESSFAEGCVIRECVTTTEYQEGEQKEAGEEREQMPEAKTKMKVEQGVKK